VPREVPLALRAPHSTETTSENRNPSSDSVRYSSGRSVCDLSVANDNIAAREKVVAAKLAERNDIPSKVALFVIRAMGSTLDVRCDE
jgi:hypothetical protein